MFQIPNLLTFLRIGFVPLIIATYFAPEDLVEQARWAALILFVMGAITDYLDGWVARRYRMESSLGKFLDPIADKLAVAAVLIMLVMTQRISGVDAVAAYLIVGREILVSGLREFLAQMPGKIMVPVSKLAKWKTAAQMTALIALLAVDAWQVLQPLAELAGVALWVAALLSVVTGWQYFKKFAETMTRDTPHG